jgi:predicted nucleic acid-binding protein
MPELADTSVWARRRHPAVAPWWEQQLLAGEIGICTTVALELLHSARTSPEMRELRRNLSALPTHTMSGHAWERALDVYQQLADQAPQHHRSVKLADLLIAVCAEEAGWPLVHYDQDYDAIAAVTGQPVRWVAPRGSL